MSDSAYLASIYRLQGVIFWESAKVLSKTIKVDTGGRPTKLTAIPFYFLISHAIELFLKSALLKRGFTEDDVKKYDYRHSIDAMLKALQKKGLCVTPLTIKIVTGLHSHTNLQFKSD